MNKFYIFITFLVSFSISDKDKYLPMDKDSKYGEDVCRYSDDDGHFHVKPCEKGKYCAIDLDQTKETSYLEICQDIPKIIHPLDLDDKCTTTFECGYGLACIGTSCSKGCGTDQFITRDEDTNSYICKNRDYKGSNEGICKETTFDRLGASTTKYSPAVKGKICGKLTISEYSQAVDRGMYYISKNEYTNIGSEPDGQYVNNMKLCESGYALYFYYDGEFDNPRPSSSISTRYNSRYLKCVTPISISDTDYNSETCTIHYKIDDKEYIYNLAMSSENSILFSYYCTEKYIKIKSDRYREFSKNVTQVIDTCGDLDGINKYTCENREVIKSWYFYKNPEDYIIYNGREKLEKVLDYLIQAKYPTYYSFSRFLNISLLLFIILFLF